MEETKHIYTLELTERQAKLLSHVRYSRLKNSLSSRMGYYIVNQNKPK